MKNTGGLELPNVHHYFLPNKIQYILKWMYSNHEIHPWMNIEQMICKEINLYKLTIFRMTI